MNKDPKFDEIAQQRRDLVKPAATRALQWLFVERGIDARIQSIEPFNSALNSISHSTHPIDILKINVVVTADTFENLATLTKPENYTTNEDGTISLTIFAKMSTLDEALREVKGAYVIKQVDSELCAIEYIYPPVDILPEDLPIPSNANKMILSIYDSELRTMGQVLGSVFTQSPKHIYLMFEKIAKLHGHSVIHGDLFLRNISIKPNQIQFLDTAYVEFMAPIYAQRLYEVQVNALTKEDEPQFFEFLETIRIASRKIPVLNNFPITVEMDKREAFKNLQRRAFLFDLERLFASKELDRLNTSITSSMIKLQYRRVLDQGIESYLEALEREYTGITNPQFNDAVRSLAGELFI